MSIYSDLKEALQLIDSVKDLKTNVEKLADVVTEIDKRLIRLEERFGSHAENVKVAAMSAASAASHASVVGLHEKLSAIEKRIDQTERHLPKMD
jgi:predicted  nucleic acid-binding Zn-ribbon protein